MLFHPAKVPLKVFSILFKNPLSMLCGEKIRVTKNINADFAVDKSRNREFCVVRGRVRGRLPVLKVHT